LISYSILAKETTGSCIWTLLDTPSNFEDLMRNLQDRYDVAEETCRIETEAFVAQAIKRGMLEPQG
jgi:hypothetical protein